MRKVIIAAGLPALVQTATDAVLEEAQAWQNQPLELTCAILYFDALR